MSELDILRQRMAEMRAHVQACWPEAPLCGVAPKPSFASAQKRYLLRLWWAVKGESTPP